MNMLKEKGFPFGDEDEEEKSWLKRIGGKHTARLDYNESEEQEIEEEEEL